MPLFNVIKKIYWTFFLNFFLVFLHNQCIPKNILLIEHKTSISILNEKPSHKILLRAEMHTTEYQMVKINSKQLKFSPK